MMDWMVVQTLHKRFLTLSLEQYKLKPLTYNTTHQIERLKFRRLTISSIGKDMWQLEILYIVGWVENDAATLANFWQFFIKFTFTLAPRNFSPRYLSKINENIYPYKTYTWMLIPTFYIIAKPGKNTNAHQQVSGLLDLWHIHTMKFYQ